MNEVLKAIQERRSIRKFKPDMVPCQLVDEIITAGLYAASGMGRQNTKIIAITDKSIRDKFSDMNRAIGGWKERFDPFYGAPVVLLDSPCQRGSGIRIGPGTSAKTGYRRKLGGNWPLCTWLS